MSRIISALILAVAAVTAFASEPLKLADNAPDRYMVVKGDTLWGISGKFLKEPWRWPEIWRLNKDQIKNPHLIYPGDIVLLDYADGRPRLRLGKPLPGRLSPKVHEEVIGQEIPAIPPQAIEPYISQPLVVDANELIDAPRIIGTEESRVIMGNGDEIFVLGVQEDHPRWYIYRPGTPLKDPTTQEVLGYEAVYLGTAQMKQPGEVAIMEILGAREEVLKGDLLVPAEPPHLSAYVPRRAEQDIVGEVMSVYGGVSAGGRNSVITINQGSQAGVEVGHVLGMFGKRSTVFKDKEGRNQTMALPEERYGLVFVFRTFDRVAYALVMEASRPLAIGDAVRNP
ncbi:MAG: LysM peptidoglycan-binding domain-containing protein [Azovibrio sp.]|uniref:LysM peptidoglycan-binding domain-containing protein n=1 Tax=Azovibrio sp. TaxID=1872673 RepID=UPI003C72A808